MWTTHDLELVDSHVKSEPHMSQTQMPLIHLVLYNTIISLQSMSVLMKSIAFRYLRLSLIAAVSGGFMFCLWFGSESFSVWGGGEVTDSFRTESPPIFPFLSLVITSAISYFTLPPPLPPSCLDSPVGVA